MRTYVFNEGLFAKFYRKKNLLQIVKNVRMSNAPGLIKYLFEIEL